MTKRLKECGKLLDIEVYDHLVISNYGYLSMKDEFTLIGIIEFRKHLYFRCLLHDKLHQILH